jgi:hypothetical protein
MRLPTGHSSDAPVRSGTPYIAPALGIEAFRDAAAAVRALAADDGEGIHAILSGTDAPRHVAWALVIIAHEVCRRGHLDNAGITALLAEIVTSASDCMLDQPQPSAPPKGR